MIQITKQKVIINNEDVFLFGGELHYFRIPKGEWRDRIRKLKEAGANLVSTYIPWKFHEMEEGHIDLTGETRPERDLPAFLELIQEEGMYSLVRPGPYVMAEIVDHGVPTWLIDKYPEAVAKTKEGNIHPTRVVSYMHPVFLEKTEIWYEAVCRVIKPFLVTNGGPVIMFQLDNEVGMFHWVTNTADYNPVTLAQFAEFLSEKYSEAALKETYGTESETFPEFMIKDIPEEAAHALHNDFSLFLRQHYKQFIEHLKHSSEVKGMDVPFVVNIHGFHTVDLLKRGTMYPIGISQLLETAKIENVLMAGDYYIGNIEYDNYIDIVLANAFTKSIQWNEQPLFSAEFQGGSISDKPRLQPSSYDLTTRLCVADGMNAVNYYMFAGGVNYEGIGLHGKWHEWQAPLSSKGEKRPQYPVIQHLGNMFSVFEKQLVDTFQQVDTHLAFYPDYFMTEFKDEVTAAKVDEIQRSRENYLFNGMAKGLRHANINFAAVNLLADEPIDPKEVPVLWMFSAKWMDEAVQQKLVHYVKDGGTLVLFPVIPKYTMKNEPCTVLKDFIGADSTMSTSEFFRTEDMVNLSAGCLETYNVEEGVFAWSEGEDKAPAAFEKSLGEGKVIVFGAGLELDFAHKLEAVKLLACKANVDSSWELDDEVDAVMRSGADGSGFVFLNNFDEYVKETRVVYQGKELFGGKPVTVPSKGGLMLPVQVPLDEDFKIVYGTGEIFGYGQTADRMTLAVKVPERSVEFMFQSAKWIPAKSDGIRVTDGGDGFYTVSIQTYENSTVIEFSKKQGN